MPVRIEIKDGLATTPWLSQAVIPGRLNSNNSFSPSTNILPRNQRFDFRITVHNTGNEDTAQPVGAGLTGAFGTADPLAGGTTSPNGNSSLVVFYNPAGFSDLLLRDAAGNDLLLHSVLPTSYRFGYSPSGKYVVVQLLETGGLAVRVYAAEPIGSGASAFRAGQLVFSVYPGVQAGAGLLPSSGIGFVRNREMLFLVWTTVSGIDFSVVDLAPGVSASARQHYWPGSGAIGQFLFSPSGDLLVAIPPTTGDIISLYSLRTPISTGPFDYRSKGMPVPAAVVQGAVNFFQDKATGIDAIRIVTNAGSTSSSSRNIDSPTPSLPAVAVNLWVDRSSTVFSSLTATQYPMAIASTMNPPSAFIDRIEALRNKDAIVDANWLAVTPPPGEHFCAIAEAFTTPGTQPPDPRHRSGTALSLTEIQIAQRNLVVGP